MTSLLRPLLFSITTYWVITAAGPAVAQEVDDPRAEAQPLSVSARLTGIEEAGLREKVASQSDLLSEEKTFRAVAPLRRRADADGARMTTALQALGYYTARVERQIETNGNAVAITYQAVPGPKFSLAGAELRYSDDTAAPRPAGFAEIAVSPPEGVLATNITETEDALEGWFRRNGFPAARVLRHELKANPDTASARAVFYLETGPKTYLADIRILSDDLHTDPDLIRELVTWDHGALFNQQDLIAFQSALAQTGLFRSVDVAPGPPDAEGLSEVLVRVEERKHRSFGAGISFATDVGVGGQVFWENRNLFRHGELLRADIDLSGEEQGLAGKYVTDFPRLDAELSASLGIRNEVSDAFDSASISLSGGLSRDWRDGVWTGSGFARYTASTITDADGTEETFSYVSLPLSVRRDTQNDTLNPTDGSVVAATLTPFAGDVSFSRLRVSAADHLSFGETDRTVLAGRLAVGTIFGDDRQDIPATERFYAGGGASVRGYAFRAAGPLDPDNDPLGGTSLLEGSIEVRQRIRDNYQLALFIDGGSVSDSEASDFGEEIFWGGGAGIRYLTPVGPLRVDVAVPLNGRDSDDDFQLYLALGQPF